MRNGNVGSSRSVDALVTALCLDFPRRERAIRDGTASKRTLTEFHYLNFKIVEAVTEVVEERYVRLYIKEIGENVGYAKSKSEGLGESLYKTRKKTIKENIARKLHLTD